MPIEWDLPAPFTSEVTVGETDIDGLGHANNASYIVWCEKCAWQHSESLGLSLADYQALDRGVAIHHAEYDYHQPTFCADRLIIATWLIHCDGRLRLQRRFQVALADTGDTVLRGQWNLVSVVLSTGKTTRLPRVFAETYSSAVVQVPTA